MLIPIRIHYRYKEYRFSARATKYSKLQGMAAIIGWLVGFFAWIILSIPLMLLMNSQSGAWVGLILGIIIGIIFTRRFRAAMGKKVEAALREDLPKKRPETDAIPVTEDREPVPVEPAAREEKEDEPPAPAYAVWLVCVGGHMNGRVYPITAEQPLTFGRLPGNLLRFPADYPGVSREHARLSLENGKLLLTDLGSTDGTVIFGKGQLTPMVPQELTPGDIFYIGAEDNAFEIRS